MMPKREIAGGILATVGFMLSPAERAAAGRELRQDLWISLAYTGLIVALIKLGVLKPIQGYFGRA